MPSQIQADEIVDLLATGAPEFTKGITVPSNKQISVGNINVTGVATFAQVQVSTNINVSGILTAASYIGDGSALTGLTALSKASACAQIIIT